MSSSIGTARAFLALALGSALFGSMAPSPLYGVYQSRWHFSSTTLTALFTVYAVGVLVSLMTMGRVSDRHADRRVVIVPALVVVLSGSLVFAWASSLTGLFLGRLLTGLGSGALSGVCTAALADLDAASGRRPRAAMIATLAFTSGAALGPLTASAALHLGVWPTALPFVVDALLAVAAIAGLLRGPWPGASRASSASSSPLAQPSWSGQFRPVRRRFIVACAVVVAAWSVGAAFMAFGPTLARKVLLGLGTGGAGLVAALFQVVAGCSQMAAPRLARRTTVQAGLVLLVMSMAGCMGALETGSAWCLGLAAITGGIGYGAGFVGSSRAVTEIAPPNRHAQLASMYLVAGYLGSAASTIGLGALTDALGLQGAVSVFAALLLGGVVLIMVSIRRLPR
ncbi:MFS transporter [Azohydromonas australica]|uniref:MFS transporter n=1 Tax=Azohydromonas australica TaxID=364039 RepID=UPI001EE4C82C|nr:MFS transporter [Azohydromonas australica]